jgi:hypothetical protein
VYGVRCTVCGGRRAVYGVRCTVYGVRCTVDGVLCTVYYVRCTMYGVLCTVYYVRCTVYGVRCTACGVLCTVYGLLVDRSERKSIASIRAIAKLLSCIGWGSVCGYFCIPSVIPSHYRSLVPTLLLLLNSESFAELFKECFRTP